MKPGEVRRSSGADEVGGHDVACSVFLARHSAYVDDELMPRERSAHEAHQATCASCARYARVLASGVDVLKLLPAVEPSPDFEARLQHRLFHVQDESALSPRGRSSRAWLAAAAALTLLVAGDRVLDGRTAEAGSVAQQDIQAGEYDAAGWAPSREASAQNAAARGSRSWAAPAWEASARRELAWEPGWSVTASSYASQMHSSAAVLLHSPTYSPVVVQPPLFRRVSAVAAD